MHTWGRITSKEMVTKQKTAGMGASRPDRTAVTHIPHGNLVHHRSRLISPTPVGTERRNTVTHVL